MNLQEEIVSLWKKKWDKKLATFLDLQVIQKKNEILDTFKLIINEEMKMAK